MSMTRRRMLYYLGLGGVAAAAVWLAPKTSPKPSQNPMPPEPIVKVQNTKRLGSFEESGRAVVEWLQKNELKPETLQQFEAFKASLNFELDPEIDAFVRSIKDQSNKKEFVRKKEYIFELNTPPSQTRLVALFGRIISETKIGISDVRILDSVIGQASFIGRNIPGTNRVYVFKDDVKDRAIPTEARTASRLGKFYSVFKEHYDEINNMLNKKPFNWDEFVSFSEALAKKCGATSGDMLNILSILKLKWKNKEKYNNFDRTEDRKRAAEDLMLSVLIHEMTHSELNRVFTAKNMPVDGRIDELFGVLIELAYGRAQHPRMETLLAYLQNPQEVSSSYLWVARLILTELKRIDYDRKKLLAGDEEEIKELALPILHQVSLDIFDQPFEQIVKPKLFDQARKFVEGIN